MIQSSKLSISRHFTNTLSFMHLLNNALWWDLLHYEGQISSTNNDLASYVDQFDGQVEQFLKPKHWKSPCWASMNCSIGLHYMPNLFHWRNVRIALNKVLELQELAPRRFWRSANGRGLACNEDLSMFRTVGVHVPPGCQWPLQESDRNVALNFAAAPDAVFLFWVAFQKQFHASVKSHSMCHQGSQVSRSPESFNMNGPPPRLIVRVSLLP